MRIAIVGSGIAGLGAAWLLRREHDITLFEADDRVGGHTHTVTVEGRDGPLAIDTDCVTLDEDRDVRADRIVRRFVADRPRFREGRAAAERRHRELIGVNRTSSCGAYWGDGFHEDGLASAVAVGEAFGSRL